MIYQTGFMYSMAAFGPVLGFLLGAYLLSFHMDAFSGNNINIGKLTLKGCFE
jgi:organic anion transporter 3A